MEKFLAWGDFDTDTHSLIHVGVKEDEWDLSRAVQSQRDEADINVIVRNFGLTGKIPEGVRVPSYGDFTGVSDYQSAIHAIREADESFMQMPADVRNRFDNDAGRFVEFCSNPANLPELRKLGLAVPEVVPDPPPIVPPEA